MKKVFTLILVITFTINALSQVPEKMSYQAVIRNASGELVKSNPVGMKISILQGSATGTPVYVETQNPTTNVNGLVTLEIGGGIVVTGTFSGVNWSTGPYFIKTETDPSGGTSYTIIGTSQLLSVPYALYAKTTSNVDGLKQQIKTLEDNLIAAGTYKLSDCEGNQYSVIKIGTQTWMKENLRTSKYNDCTDIPLVTNDAEWISLTTPAYCWYNNDISNKDTYGLLYNGYTIQTGKLCPTGWHVPTLDDCRILLDPYRTIDTYINPVTGMRMDGVPGGTGELGIELVNLGMGGVFWTSSIDYGHAKHMWYYPIPFEREWDRVVTASIAPPMGGLSVRCIRD